jgi:hypothetical protein
MAACWFCHELIEDTAPIPAPVPPKAPAVVTPPPPRPVAPTPRAVPRRLPRRHRVSAGQVVLEGFVAAMLLTVGLLAVEAFMPKYTTTTPAVSAMRNVSFPELGFSVDHPATWDVDRSRVGVSFQSGDPSRGFRIAPVDIDFDDVKDESEELDRSRFTSHDVLDTGRGERAGREAYKRILAVEGLRIDQWWIETDDGALRAEFWSRLADEDAADINRAIVETLEVR